MRRYALLLGMSSVLVLSIAWLLPRTEASRNFLQLNPLPTFRTSDVPSLGPAVDVSAVEVPVPLELSPGETLGALLQDGCGLDSHETQSFLGAVADRVNVRRLRPGQIGLAYFRAADDLSRVELRLEDGCLEMHRDQVESWRPSWRAFDRQVRIRRLQGELTDSLESSIRKAGGQAQLAYRMADVLQWDLDFNRDLRTGDRFEVLYEEMTLDGEPAPPGDIRALIYENRGQQLEAYRYGDADAYYDAEGRPLQKMFLRSPLPFTRITSRFSKRRFHPVLKVHRPHYGVDYGAPTGTPVRATATGTVVFAGRKGGAGNMVKLRHTSGYLTAYLHLSKFAPAARVGKRVRQGEIIGHVGATGLATAPHLDYRVQKDGRWIDPLSLKSVAAPPIARRDLPRFLAHRDTLRLALRTGDRSSEPEGLAPERHPTAGSRPSTQRAAR